LNTLRTLLVGVGGRGEWPLRLCQVPTGFRITALCDSNEKALEKARAIAVLEEKACFDDFEKAIIQSPIECVIVCTPTTTHAQIAKLCIDKGLPVLIEKGMAESWSSSYDLIRHVKSRNGILCVAQNYRYNGMEQTICRLLTIKQDSRYLGKAFFIDYTHHRVRPEPRNLSYPFASIWDMSCHHLDNLLFWFGKVEEVTAHSFAAPWSRYGFPNNTCAFLRFVNGVEANYCHMHDASRGEMRIALHADFGAVFVRELTDTAGITRNPRIEYSKRPKTQFGVESVEIIPPAKSLGEIGVLNDFYSYITEGKEPGISGYANLEVMAMCQMMVMSISQNRTIYRNELPSL
jgi:predicted dehydrogenase